MTMKNIRPVTVDRASLETNRYFVNLVSAGVSGVRMLGIAPNTLTYLSLAIAAGSGVSAAMGHYYWASALLIASGLCDLLDGPTARATNQTTRYGALLDSSIDRVSDAAPLAGLVFFYAGDRWFAIVPCLVIIATFMVSYVRARAESLGFKLPWLWMRRGERLVLIATALLLGGFTVPGLDIPSPLMLFGVGLVGFLSCLAAISAMRAANAQIE